MQRNKSYKSKVLPGQKITLKGALAWRATLLFSESDIRVSQCCGKFGKVRWHRRSFPLFKQPSQIGFLVLEGDWDSFGLSRRGSVLRRTILSFGFKSQEETSYCVCCNATKGNRVSKDLGLSRNYAMINYRVDNLKAFVKKLLKMKIVVDSILEGQVAEGIGKFAHLNDPEGNRIELWQPSGGVK